MYNMFLLLVVLNYALLVCCSKDVTLIRGVQNDRESSERKMRIDKIMQDLQGMDSLGNQHQTVKELKKETRSILNNIAVYKDVVKLNTQLRKEIQWIIQESTGKKETRRVLDLIKPVRKGICSPPKYKDCTELKKKSKKKLNDGVYKIYPGGDKPVQAYCDMTTDGGGWTVIMKRYGGTVDFKRKWVECENGFGNINGDFWFGNKKTHIMTSNGKYELRVDMVDKNYNKRYAVYKNFIVGDAASKYILTVGGYSGNAGDYLTFHSGVRFSTVDQDNDTDHKTNCAKRTGGSWWYNNCARCDLTRTTAAPYWTGFLILKSVMMIRKL